MQNRILTFLIAGWVLLLISCTSTTPPATPLDKYLKDLGTMDEKYIYQSVIRMANTSKSENFEALIKDIKYIKLYTSRDSTFQMADLKSKLRNEGYETLIETRLKEQQVALWLKDDPTKPLYVGLMDGGDSDMILTMDGKFHLEYLLKLTGDQQSALQNILLQ